MCFLLAALVSTASVLAQERSEVERVRAAAAEFDAGRKAFSDDDFTTAAEHFENADREAPAPEALRMAIRARMSAKQFDRAATLAASALLRYPSDEETASFARETLKKVPSSLHRIQVNCTEPCALLLDRKIVPLPESTMTFVYVEPGQREITAGWSKGRTQARTVDAVASAQSTLSFETPPLESKQAELPPTKTSEPSPPAPTIDTGTSTADSPSQGLPPAVFFGAVGLTTVLGGVTVWSALDMRAHPGKDKVRKDCAGKDESCSTYKKAINSQKRTNVLLVTTGIAAAGTAVVGIFTDFSGSKTDTESTQSSMRLTPVLDVSEGVFLGASGLF
jgi:hypothetical protein